MLFRLIIENKFYLHLKDNIIKHIDSRIKCILIFDPSNSTWYVYSNEELKLLASIEIEYDLWIISDEVYIDFVYSYKEYISLVNTSETKDRVFLMIVFLKGVMYMMPEEEIYHLKILILMKSFYNYDR